MGYYTEFNLKTMSKNMAPVREFCSSINRYGLDIDGDTSESMKWYEHEDEIGKFSKKYPIEIFVLTGKGENEGDHWVKYFKNGQVHKGTVTIVLSPFKESELEDIDFS